MKKGSIIVVAIVIVAIIAGGSYALLHKSPSTTTASTSSAPAANNAALVTKTSSSHGQYFTEPNGKPLYTYGGDSKGVSNCTGACLALWPAYQDKAGTANLPTGVGTMKRTDNGEIQFTYNGLPLYTFVSDIDGHVTGDGVQNFTLAKPAASTTSSSAGQSSSSSPAATSSSSASDSNW